MQKLPLIRSSYCYVFIENLRPFFDSLSSKIQSSFLSIFTSLLNYPLNLDETKDISSSSHVINFFSQVSQFFSENDLPQMLKSSFSFFNECYKLFPIEWMSSKDFCLYKNNLE
jgi:hypothetical protein